MRAFGRFRRGRRVWECLADREWPVRLHPWVYERGLVRRGWYFRLRLRTALSNRIKVGFGPITTGENTLGLRKWHIDPIVDAINRSPSRYVGDIFFPGEDLSRFDIVVIVKHFESFTPEVVHRLHERSTRLVYDTADIRFVQTTSGWRDIYGDPDALERLYKPFLRSMDALILASPLQRRDFEDLGIPQVEIARPLLNRRHRTTYAHGSPIRVVWQGYPANLAPMQRLHPIIRRLREETGLDIRLVYDTSPPARDEGPIQYTEWKIHRWERVLVASDVGVVIKPLDDPFQQRKPPTKVVSYMAAGLPVVCTPSEADRRVIVHGETGFFAYEDREWHACLGALVTDPSLRERVGTAARQHVLEGYGMERIVADYLQLFDRLLSRGGHRPPDRRLEPKSDRAPACQPIPPNAST
jgi:glycosyltransferase involved in cell wall biosynthesis